MPDAPFRPCSGKGGRCTALVRGGGKCPACSKAKEQERGNFRQRHGGLYDTNWTNYSVSFRREFPLCGMRPDGVPPVMSRCFDEKRITPAKQTDHVIPVWQRPDLFWERSNHQSLCWPCGTAKSQAGL